MHCLPGSLFNQACQYSSQSTVIDTLACKGVCFWALVTALKAELESCNAHKFHVPCCCTHCSRSHCHYAHKQLNFHRYRSSATIGCFDRCDVVQMAEAHAQLPSSRAKIQLLLYVHDYGTS